MDTYSDCVGHFVKCPPNVVFFCWIIVFTNTYFIISTSENVYLDTNITMLGGLEVEILTRVICGLCRPFLKWPPLASVKSPA